MSRDKNKVSTITIFSIIITIFLILSTSSFAVFGNSNSSNTTDESSGRGFTRNPSVISTVIDQAYDENDDSVYDYLHIMLTLNFEISDKYTIYVSVQLLGKDGIDFLIEDFSVGEHDVIMKLPGSVIYNSGHDGPYSASITIYNSVPEIVDEMEYKTGYYSYEDFNPSPTSDTTSDQSITVINNTIQLETNIFVAVIYELTPTIIFYYTSDDGQTARFKVVYNSILCYNDEDSNGFQNDELKYWGDLINSHWDSEKTLMENFNSFEFKIQTIVDLMDNDDNPIGTKLEVVFRYSSLTKSKDTDSARKFDINIRILGPPLQGITHISLLHTLEDEMGNHKFSESPSGRKISFMTQDNSERGYYAWKDIIDVTTKGGKSQKPVTHEIKQNSEPNILYLYLKYPYSMDTSEIFHDPEVGVNPDNQPRPRGEIEPDIISHNRWLIIYFAVAIVASVIMFGNFYRQKKKREKY